MLMHCHVKYVFSEIAWLFLLTHRSDSFDDHCVHCRHFLDFVEI